MNGDSLISLLILLFLFFVLPALLKLLGQFMAQGREEEEGADEAPADDWHEGKSPHEHETAFHEEHRPREIENKPIKPRWF